MYRIYIELRLAANVVDTLRSRQYGRHFADDKLKCIFWNKKTQISITISLKFVPRCQINNMPALVHKDTPMGRHLDYSVDK